VAVKKIHVTLSLMACETISNTGWITKTGKLSVLTVFVFVLKPARYAEIYGHRKYNSYTTTAKIIGRPLVEICD